MPEQVAGVDRVRSLVGGYARECLGDLTQVGEAPRPEAAVEAAGGWTVLVLAYPVLPGEDTPVLTDCDKDCLALLPAPSCSLPFSQEFGRIISLAGWPHFLPGGPRLVRHLINLSIPQP
jgi:hypothetical protein